MMVSSLRLTLLLIFSALLISCATQSSPKKSEAFIAYPDIQTIIYDGPMTLEGAEAFQKHMQDTQQPSVNTLIINSSGGDVFAGMNMGKVVFERQLRVVVREKCGSSCANYILTASPELFVEKNAYIGWHGGSLQYFYVPLRC